MRYKLIIEPAIPPENRHKIQDALKKLGYTVHGGGTCTDGSQCDISFEKGGENKKHIKTTKH